MSLTSREKTRTTNSNMILPGTHWWTRIFSIEQRVPYRAGNSSAIPAIYNNTRQNGVCSILVEGCSERRDTLMSKT